MGYNTSVCYHFDRVVRETITVDDADGFDHIGGLPC